MHPTITLSDSGPKKQKALVDSLKALTRQQVLVGVPETDAAARQQQVIGLLKAATGKKRASNLKKAALLVVNNAQLVYLATHGSPLNNRPPRPIVEPAIQDPENQEKIVAELRPAADAALDGKMEEVEKHLKIAGLVAENAVRGWFTNPKNGWAPNAPSTIRRKGSSKPNIEFGLMRKAITSVLVKT